MSKFKVGDIVVGNADADDYVYTSSGCVMRVVGVEGLVGEFKGIVTECHPEKESAALDKEFTVYEHCFDLKESISSNNKMKEQQFVEGFEVGLIEKDKFQYVLDTSSKEISGKVGVLVRYRGYSSMYSCWVVYVSINNKEYILLESELKGYSSSPGISNTTTNTVPSRGSVAKMIELDVTDSDTKPKLSVTYQSGKSIQDVPERIQVDTSAFKFRVPTLRTDN